MNNTDQYLRNLISQNQADPIDIHTDVRFSTILDIIRQWTGLRLAELKQSGSSAKGTAIRGVADVDIFISLKSDTNDTLKDLYLSLNEYLNCRNIPTRKQNVSIGITQYGFEIDLVVGKIQRGYQNWHSIYSQKRDSTMQANIDEHISIVKKSNRQDEIMLTKIWRKNHQLDFPSIYLELIVIEAVKWMRIGNLADNFLEILRFLSDDNFLKRRVVDPSNTNNVISESLSINEKMAIALKAKECLSKSNCDQIIW